MLPPSPAVVPSAPTKNTSEPPHLISTDLRSPTLVPPDPGPPTAGCPPVIPQILTFYPMAGARDVGMNMPVIWLKVYKGKQKLNNYTNSHLLTVAKRTGKANIMCSKNLRTRDGLDSEGGSQLFRKWVKQKCSWEMVTGRQECLWERNLH